MSPPLHPAPTGLQIHQHDRLLTVAEFESLPPPAVALEAVEGPPRSRANRWSADHHAGIPRAFYDCAAKQVLVATESGLWRHLMRGLPATPLNVHILRPDEDTSLGVVLLLEPSLVAQPAVRHLVELEDALDRSGGVSARGATESELARLAWIFEPYHAWRASGLQPGREATLAFLAEIHRRVRALARGRALSVPPAGRVGIRARVGSVALVAEDGPYARLRLRAQGIDAFVSVISGGERRRMTVGLTDAFVPLDLGAVFDDLNRLEDLPEGDRWGGSDLIGGSPSRGTRLEPEQVLAVLAGHHRQGGRAATAGVGPTGGPPPGALRVQPPPPSS